MIEDAFEAGVPADLLLYDPGLVRQPRAATILTRARERGVKLITASPHVIKACSQVETPQGMIAVVEKPHAALSDVISRRDLLLLVADRVQDPGNLGTIIRIADAAGATAVAVTHGSVDPYNPKAARATMGSLFHLPVVDAKTDEAIAVLQAAGVRILVAIPTGAIVYTDADYRPPLSIVLGSEGEGPDAAWIEAANETVRIPLYGRAESLNVAVAAGLVLYEVRRHPGSEAVPSGSAPTETAQ